MTEQLTRHIGVVGLGNAGAAIARAFAAHGPVAGFDKDTGRRQAAANAGIDAFDQLEDLAAAVDVVVLSLPHPEVSVVVTTALMECDKRPDLIIDTSTVTPQTAIDCAA
ncbi:MAG: NAD(P)-binding domain-containing protein, partial [Candidatus Puniceispirillum sp.]